MNVKKAVNIDDLRRMAKRRLPRIAYDFIEGGVDDEEGLDHNARSLRRYRLAPRYCIDVSAVDTSAAIFGKTYSSPIGIAPTGLAGVWRRGGERIFAEVAAAAKIPYAMSSVASATLEMGAEVAGENFWFQVYPSRDRSVAQDMARRARDAGVETLLLTVDVPAPAKRERNIRNGYGRPPKLSLGAKLDVLAHPAWLWEYLRHGGRPAPENYAHYAPGRSAKEVDAFLARQIPCRDHTWRDVEAIRAAWPGNLVLKGLLHPADAAEAVRQGVDGIYISNHGGRQLDLAPSAIEMLPLVRAAAGGKARLMVDGGFRRGADVVLARCLGADLVFLGRPPVYGIAAAGLEGARRVIDIMKHEVRVVMSQMGCATLGDLGPDRVFDSERRCFLT